MSAAKTQRKAADRHCTGALRGKRVTGFNFTPLEFPYDFAARAGVENWSTCAMRL